MNPLKKLDEVTIPYARNKVVSENTDIYPKGSTRTLSDHLTLREFDCKCESERCNYTLLSKNLADLIFIVRKNSLEKLWITSGFRCQEHNEKVGGVRASFHTLGLAVDLAPDGGKNKVAGLYALASLFFPVVIKYDTFVHCQMENLWKDKN